MVTQVGAWCACEHWLARGVQRCTRTRASAARPSALHRWCQATAAAPARQLCCRPSRPVPLTPCCLQAVAWRVTPGGRTLIDRRRRSRVERNVRLVVEHLELECGVPFGERIAWRPRTTCRALRAKMARPAAEVPQPGRSPHPCEMLRTQALRLPSPARPANLPPACLPCLRRPQRYCCHPGALPGGHAVQAHHQRPLGPPRGGAVRLPAPQRTLQRARGGREGWELGA